MNKPAVLKRAAFVSYRHGDGEAPKRIIEAALRRAGLDVFSDAQFAAGANLSDSVLHGLTTAEVVVLLITPSWGDGEWVRREYQYARAVGKKVIHVLCGGAGRDLLDDAARRARLPPEWGVGDSAYERYLGQFPWLYREARSDDDLEGTVFDVLEAVRKVPITTLPWADEWMPLRADIPNRYLCVSGQSLESAVINFALGRTAVVTTTDRFYNMHGSISTQLAHDLAIDPAELGRRSPDKRYCMTQARGFGRFAIRNGRDVYVIAASAFSPDGAQTSGALQRGAIRDALSVAKAYACQSVFMPLFATGPTIGLPVHQASRMLLSEITSSFVQGSRDEPMAIAVSIVTEHLRDALRYMRYVAEDEVPLEDLRELDERIRVVLDGGRVHWAKREGTLRQIAQDTHRAVARCWATAGAHPVSRRREGAEPYVYEPDTKLEDTIFADREVLRFGASPGKRT